MLLLRHGGFLCKERLRDKRAGSCYNEGERRGNMLNLAAVGKKIQELRKKRGLSQDELAERLLVTRQAVSLWETGQSAPSIDNVIELHKLLRVPIDTLLCLDEPMEPDAEDIFRGYSREYVLNSMEEGTFPLPLADVFYQLSPGERMRILRRMRARREPIPYDLSVKLTLEEKRMLEKGEKEL